MGNHVCDVVCDTVSFTSTISSWAALWGAQNRFHLMFLCCRMKKTVARLKPKQTSWSHRKLLLLDFHTRAATPHSSHLHPSCSCVPIQLSSMNWLNLVVQEFSLCLAGVNQCVVCYWCRRFCHWVTPQVSSRCGFNNEIKKWQHSSLVHYGWNGSWIESHFTSPSPTNAHPWNLLLTYELWWGF